MVGHEDLLFLSKWSSVALSLRPQWRQAMSQEHLYGPLGGDECIRCAKCGTTFTIKWSTCVNFTCKADMSVEENFHRTGSVNPMLYTDSGGYGVGY